jgi:outer membrane immunogenic protein
MKRILLASGWLLVLASSISAADLPQAYTKAPAVSPAVNWSGFYIGAMGGYAWSDQLRATALDVTATSNTSETSGGFGGGTIGYNWQVDSWVFGLEAEAAGASISHSSTAFIITGTERIDAFGSVTGRVGFAAGPALIYAKGGYAWADSKLSLSVLGLVFSDSHVHSGWTVGGGVEYLFLPNWSVKGEYMYVDYSNQTYFASLLPPGVGLGATFHSVKAGINYHFGGPVVATY